MLEYRTQGFNGYSVKYSPFFDNRIAVAASANFGLVGNGRLYFLELTPKGIISLKWKVFPVRLPLYPTQDSQYDITWSEAHENQAAVACGDGSIKIFDTTVDEFPVRSWQEHQREVFSVCWNLVDKDTLCSSSWDGTIKIWRPDTLQSLLTLPTNSCTYSAVFSPHSPHLLSSVSSDSKLRLFDLRIPNSPSLVLPHSSPPSEALTHDWNKYREQTIATAGVDHVVRIWDLRMCGPQNRAGSAAVSGTVRPVSELVGHTYAVRRLAWNPHVSDVLISASYDMTVRVWSDGGAALGAIQAGPGSVLTAKEVGRMTRHTEFVTGVDWCLFGAEGWAASCGWDERLWVWDARKLMRSAQ